MTPIDYKNYKTYLYTDSQLRKKYNKEILNKYYNQLSFLYQNGFDVEANSIKDIEEQFLLYDNFENIENVEELIRVIGKTASYEIGKRIIVEELYDILKDSSFAVPQEVSFNMEKTYANINFDKIVEINDRLFQLFNSKDLEILGALKKISNLQDIEEKILKIKSYTDKAMKLPTWLSFKTLRTVIYSCYIQNSKGKSEIHKLAITSNINDELYGGAGGYNPNTNEIKAWNGTNVYDTKIIKNMSLELPVNLLKLKTLANTIIKDTKDGKIDEENEKIFKWLYSWSKGFQQDNEKARRIIVNIMLNGTLELLKLKHNLSLMEHDKKNSLRAENIRKEFEAVLKYCNIDTQYLL